MSSDLGEIRKGLHEAQAGLNWAFEEFGNYLAKREGYKNLDGIDAIHCYTIQKFSSLPRDVRSMTYDDLRFVLSQQIEEWLASRALRVTVER